MALNMVVQALGILCSVFLLNTGTEPRNADSVKSKDSSSNELNLSSNSIGGMSLLINDYYDDLLSENGVSVNNVATTIYVNGERLAAKDKSSTLFYGLALANVNDYVNVRANASTESEVIGRLYRAAAAKVEGVYGDWVKITSDEVTGFVKKDYLYTGNQAVTFAKQMYKQQAKVTCNVLNVRTGPGKNYNIKTQVYHGDHLEVIKVLDDWVQVRYNSGRVGYIYKSYVDFSYDFEYAVACNAIQTDISRMVWPLPSDHNIYSYYGYRIAPTKGASSFHEGLDIGGPKGSNIVSVLSGKVITVGYSSGRGNYVEIDHGNQYVTRYLHCSKILVQEGDNVRQGEAIALVGSTGISTAPHLHFSLVKNGKNIDPFPYLKHVQ